MNNYFTRFVIGMLPNFIAIICVYFSINYISNQYNIDPLALSLIRIFELCFFGFGVVSTVLVGYVLKDDNKGKRSMTKPKGTSVLANNIGFFILTLLASITFLMQVANTASSILDVNSIRSIGFTAFDLTITADNEVRKITNYMLIPLTAGVIYNTYVIWKQKNAQR